VKLADFGAGSILRPALEKPVVARPAPAAAEGPRPRATGRIYTTASLGTDERGMPISSGVAFDPEGGDMTKIFNKSPYRLRVSSDGQSAGFVSIEWWSNLPPFERMRKYLWITRFTDGARPERVVRLEGSAETGGELPV
jgi:hypothetical protein